MPKGSCVGPLTFLIFTNDLPSSLLAGIDCLLYADDVKLSTVNNPKLFQDALCAVCDWARKWELDISMDKTVVLHIGNNHPQVDFSIGNHSLRQLKSFKHLGICYDDHFDFEEHIDDIVYRAKWRANFILRAFHSRNICLLFRAFTTYVRPILEYGSPLWSPYKFSLKDKIEQVQKSFTYRIFLRAGKSRVPYGARLRLLNSLTLEDRRIVSDLALMYKMTTGEIDIDLCDLFLVTPRGSVVRGQPFRLCSPR